MVVVFEDLTELEKAQRMAAWREVARRIAHEVKNPLTPIKLSAQRLIRRYGDSMAPEDKVFGECTTTIVRQVEELRRLVNEFSTFARLPSSRLAPGNLVLIAEDTLSLYRGAHPEISFDLDREQDIPVFDLDREQMSRVLINLLDNAVAAVEITDPPRQVAVRLSYDEILKIVRLEVEDSGPGVPPENRLRLFEPYFSTKKGRHRPGAQHRQHHRGRPQRLHPGAGQPAPGHPHHRGAARPGRPGGQPGGGVGGGRLG